MVSGDNKDLEEGVYKYDSAYRFEEYLTELGVPWYLRALAKYASPTVTIKKLPDYSGKLVSGLDFSGGLWALNVRQIFKVLTLSKIVYVFFISARLSMKTQMSHGK